MSLWPWWSAESPEIVFTGQWVTKERRSLEGEKQGALFSTSLLVSCGKCCMFQALGWVLRQAVSKGLPQQLQNFPTDCLVGNKSIIGLNDLSSNGNYPWEIQINGILSPLNLLLQGRMRLFTPSDWGVLPCPLHLLRSDRGQGQMTLNHVG